MPVLRTCRLCCGMSDFKYGLNQPHHITNADLSNEVGGIAKRIKTARLRRKTNLQKSDYPKAQIKRYPNPFCPRRCDELCLPQ